MDLKSAIIEAPKKGGAFVYSGKQNSTALNQSASSESAGNGGGADKKKKSGLSKIAGAFMKKLF